VHRRTEHASISNSYRPDMWYDYNTHSADGDSGTALLRKVFTNFAISVAVHLGELEALPTVWFIIALESHPSRID
jgi:hypothetical protein